MSDALVIVRVTVSRPGEMSMPCTFRPHKTKSAYDAHMAIRGPYAKGKAKRAEILDVALGVIARDGYSGATVKQLADAVGLSQNGLLRYFGSKENLFVEIVKHHGEDLQLRVDPEHRDFSIGFAAGLLDAMTDTIATAGLSQLLLSLTMAAAEQDHAAHDFIGLRYAAFREIAESALRKLQERGEFPANGDPAAAAVLIVAAFDGLQTQWIYDRSLDARVGMAYLVDALGIRHSEAPERLPSETTIPRTA